MNRKLLYWVPLVFLAVGCEEKKLQQEHKIDLFANERQEGKAYVMKPQECFDESDLVISSADINLIDKSSGRGKLVFIYKVNSGDVLKSTRDSVVNFPFHFLSTQQLMFRRDAASYIYLKKLQGYRFIAKPMHLKYTWLKAAPVYPVKTDQ